jgi:cytochrome c5
VLNSGIIKVNDPSGSDIYEVITTNNLGKVMPPPPRAKLNADQASLILKWIQQGAQNLSCDATDCDTTNVTYAATVVPILQASCTGCHSGTSPSGGINLSTHASVAAVANNGKLYGSIARLSGFSAMPQGGNKLPDCQISQIRIWIDAGALDN